MNDRFDELRRRIIAFRDERDWRQFHDPKNLAEGLSVEAGELLEVFLWKPSGEAAELDEADRQRVREEAADVFMFLVYLSEAFGFDLLEATKEKLAVNGRKYPVEKARGRSDKYNRL